METFLALGLIGILAAVGWSLTDRERARNHPGPGRRSGRTAWPKALSSAPALDSSAPAPPGIPSGTDRAPAVLSHSAREWGPILAELGPDVPLAVALAWIDQESGGNVCSIGNKPSPGAKYPAEYGLSQLDSGNPENVAIMSPAAARAACQNSGAALADWQVQLRPLTSAERTMHAMGALDHMRSARYHARASTAGWGWDPNGADTWRMAKLYHAGPAYVRLASIVAKELGRSVRDFAEYRALANIAGTRAGMTQGQLNRAWNNVAHFSARLGALT